MAKYTKNELQDITEKLCKLFESHSDRYTLKKLRGNSGWYHFDTDEFELDYREDIISTLVHEAFHCWNPDWTETRVEKAEKNIINQLSVEQIKQIIKKFAEIL